ncbi:hypothetical protein [Paenibacillus fonticola]|uniref:hypothetical protein n=1 Tax=Paenibacillus fonticola TaxID=379896 RepID=UPI00037AA612|nr:hypothetical protein [Paenibacillus fonticola]
MYHSCFVYDDRLDMHVPALDQPFETYNMNERLAMIEEWENIRGQIPTKVMALERLIERKLLEMGNENDFEKSCRINGEIAELASRIHDLQIWYRVSQDEPTMKTHL